MKQVLPDAQIVPLDVYAPDLRFFFQIKTLKGMHHPDRERPGGVLRDLREQ